MGGGSSTGDAMRVPPRGGDGGGDLSRRLQEAGWLKTGRVTWSAREDWRCGTIIGVSGRPHGPSGSDSERGANDARAVGRCGALVKHASGLRGAGGAWGDDGGDGNGEEGGDTKDVEVIGAGESRRRREPS